MHVTVMRWNASKMGKMYRIKILVCHTENCTTADLFLVLLMKTCICTNNNNNNYYNSLKWYSCEFRVGKVCSEEVQCEGKRWSVKGRGGV